MVEVELSCGKAVVELGVVEGVQVVRMRWMAPPSSLWPQAVSQHLKLGVLPTHHGRWVWPVASVDTDEPAVSLRPPPGLVVEALLPPSGLPAAIEDGTKARFLTRACDALQTLHTYCPWYSIPVVFAAVCGGELHPAFLFPSTAAPATRADCKALLGKLRREMKLGAPHERCHGWNPADVVGEAAIASTNPELYSFQLSGGARSPAVLQHLLDGETRVAVRKSVPPPGGRIVDGGGEWTVEVSVPHCMYAAGVVVRTKA